MRSSKMRLVIIGAAMGLMGSACATDSASRSAGVTVDDAAITATVKSKLTMDTDTKARQINVETQDGIVQLNGFVDSNAARSQAEKLAAGTDGVKQVRNNLEVRTEDRVVGEVIDDAVVTGKVDAALAADKRTSAMSIDVETHEGEVQLSGFVKSQTEKNAADEVAKTVKGVRSVKNEIDIR